MAPFELGIFRDVFKTCDLLWTHPAGAFFRLKTAFSKKINMVSFQHSEFSSKTQFLGHSFGEISHKSSSYGPYGPF